MGRTPEEKKAQLENVLWSALDAAAGKRKDRDGLVDGAKHDVDLTVAGEIDGQWVEADLHGQLLINHDSSVASSVAPDYERLVAILLNEIPVRRRQRLVADLPAQFVQQGELPAPPDELPPLASRLLKGLRQSKTSNRRGSVRFEAQPT